MQAVIGKQIPDAVVTLVPGSKGVFNIECNGQIIFAKEKHQRFPKDEEIIELLNSPNC